MSDRQSTGSSPMSSNVDIVRRYYNANTASAGGGDADAEVALLDPNVDWQLGEGYAMSGRYIGIKAVMEGIVPALLDAFEEFSNMPEEFLDAGDNVVVLGRYRGRTKDTKNELNAEFAHIWTVRSGRIVRLRQYTDTAEFTRALEPEASRQLEERLRAFRMNEEDTQ